MYFSSESVVVHSLILKEMRTIKVWLIVNLTILSLLLNNMEYVLFNLTLLVVLHWKRIKVNST